MKKIKGYLKSQGKNKVSKLTENNLKSQNKIDMESLQKNYKIRTKIYKETKEVYIELKKHKWI